MNLELDVDGRAGRISDRDDFGSFAVQAGAPVADLVVAFPGDLREADADHLWVRAAAVVHWAGDVDETWRQRFRAMLSKVEPYGWYDSALDEVRAHVVRP